MLNSKYERGHLWPWTCGDWPLKTGISLCCITYLILDINKMERTLILFQIICKLYDIVTAQFKLSIRCLSPRFFANSVVTMDTCSWKCNSFVTNSSARMRLPKQSGHSGAAVTKWVMRSFAICAVCKRKAGDRGNKLCILVDYDRYLDTRKIGIISTNLLDLISSFSSLQFYSKVNLNT